jgi:hypothetical protein
MIATDKSIRNNPSSIFNDPSFLKNFDLVSRNMFLKENYGTTSFECDYIKICKEPSGNNIFERQKSWINPIDWFTRMTFRSDGVRTVVEKELFGKKIILYQTDEPISFQAE